MAKLSSSSSSTKTSNVAANKERYKNKVKHGLEVRKDWRIKKYGAMKMSELTRNTLNLFIKWGHRKEEAVSALKMKQFKAPKKRVGGFKGHWE